MWKYKRLRKLGLLIITMCFTQSGLKDTITLAQADYKSLQSNSHAREMASAMGLHGSSPVSIAAELEKLFELKQKGILSEDEYLRAKNKLIG